MTVADGFFPDLTRNPEVRLIRPVNNETGMSGRGYEGSDSLMCFTRSSFSGEFVSIT
jgi:hypothetical protein